LRRLRKVLQEVKTGNELAETESRCIAHDMSCVGG
jgi:hypothetical protein